MSKITSLRFRLIIHFSANTSSIIFVGSLLCGLFGGGRRGLDGGCSGNGSMLEDTVVAAFATALCVEVARTVVVVLAGVTFVAFTFEVVFAQF